MRSRARQRPCCFSTNSYPGPFVSSADERAWHTGTVPAEVLHTQDHVRHGARAFQRLEITDGAVVVIVHELGPPRGPDDEARGERWSAWVEQLSPPTLTDDRGTVYALERRGKARGAGGNPR